MSNRLVDYLKSPSELKSLMRRKPQQDRSLKRVDIILDVTSELIVELGIENVNAGLIAKKSGIPVGTIYQFFTDMEAISTEIIIRNKKRVDERIVQRCAEQVLVSDFRKGIEEMVDIFIDGVKEEPGLTDIIRALIHTKPYVESRQITINHLSTYLAQQLIIAGAKIPEEKAYLVGSLVFHASYPLYEKILMEEDPEIASLYKEELETMVKQYLSLYLEDI